MNSEIEAFEANRHYVFKCYMKDCGSVEFTALSDGSIQCADSNCNQLYKYTPMLKDWVPITDDSTPAKRKPKSKRLKRQLDMENDQDISDDEDCEPS